MKSQPNETRERIKQLRSQVVDLYRRYQESEKSEQEVLRKHKELQDEIGETLNRGAATPRKTNESVKQSKSNAGSKSKPTPAKNQRRGSNAENRSG